MLKIITRKEYKALILEIERLENENENLHHYKKQAEFLRGKVNELTKSNPFRNPKTGRFEKVKEETL